MDHFYVYVYVRTPHPCNGSQKPYYYYERTCGTEKGAQDRVNELKKRGQEALFLINHLIKGAFY